MSIKLNISYTYEREREYLMGLLKPLLDTGCGCKTLSRANYNHIYIPRKGSLEVPKEDKNNT